MLYSVHQRNVRLDTMESPCFNSLFQKLPYFHFRIARSRKNQSRTSSQRRQLLRLKWVIFRHPTRYHHNFLDNGKLITSHYTYSLCLLTIKSTVKHGTSRTTKYHKYSRVSSCLYLLGDWLVLSFTDIVGK